MRYVVDAARSHDFADDRIIARTSRHKKTDIGGIALRGLAWQGQACGFASSHGRRS